MLGDEVRVRGKRKRPVQRSTSDRPRELLKPPSQLARTRKANMATRKPRRKKLTELERLPLELLELIFFYALNPNMARASPLLGKALSSERIFRRLIVEAFCCADASFQTPGEQKDLQCELLSTKWCTLRRTESLSAPPRLESGMHF